MPIALALDALAVANFVIWGLAVLWLFPSWVRHVTNSPQRRRSDSIFSLIWFGAVIFLLYRVREFAGLAPDVTGAPDGGLSTVALRALGLSFAVGILWKKIDGEGWAP